MHTNTLILFLVSLITADKTGNISRIKCYKYAEAVFKVQESPLLLPRARQIATPQCDIVGVPLIVGGKDASEKEFPHMAVIGYGTSPNDTLVWQCGGALISDRFVLTAAHCMFSRENGPAQKVKLGVINLDLIENLQEIAISERIVYPGYKPPSKYHDIALLRLLDVVEFTPFVRPACLNAHDDIISKMGTATGFGKLSYESSIGSKHLMKVDINIVSNEECSKRFPRPVYRIALPLGITGSMLCAGELLGGKDTCQGDSGGPFQTVLEEPYCMYNLIGITSFGQYCGFANSPAVYTRVSYYLKWIEDTVWG